MALVNLAENQHFDHLDNLEPFSLSQLFQSCGAVANEVVTTVCVPVVHLDPDDDDCDHAADADAEVANEDVATVQPPQVMEMLMVLSKRYWPLK